MNQHDHNSDSGLRLIEKRLDVSELNNRPLERIFHSAAARMVDFFIAFKEYDYNEADIARKTDLSQKTVSKEIETLLNENIIRITRKTGRSNMYKLNDEYAEGLISHVNNVIDWTIRKLDK